MSFILLLQVLEYLNCKINPFVFYLDYSFNIYTILPSYLFIIPFLSSFNSSPNRVVQTNEIGTNSTSDLDTNRNRPKTLTPGVSQEIKWLTTTIKYIDLVAPYDKVEQFWRILVNRPSTICVLNTTPRTQKRRDRSIQCPYTGVLVTELSKPGILS